MYIFYCSCVTVFIFLSVFWRIIVFILGANCGVMGFWFSPVFYIKFKVEQCIWAVKILSILAISGYVEARRLASRCTRLSFMGADLIWHTSLHCGCVFICAFEISLHTYLLAHSWWYTGAMCSEWRGRTGAEEENNASGVEHVFRLSPVWWTSNTHARNGSKHKDEACRHQSRCPHPR